MRIVSLVPSLTEAVAATLPGALVGITDWCTHPAGLTAERIGGSKYPDLDRVLALRPDVVLVNVEENREQDADALRAAGIELYVTYPRTVDQALDELARMLTALGAPAEPDWLTEARTAWSDLRPPSPRRAIVPVWRRPWIVLGGDTFAGDVLRRLGITNVYEAADERYPRPSLDDLQACAADLIVLPDEPYPFTAADGPEAFPGTPCALVSGRHLTWYGPSLAEAPTLLTSRLTPPHHP
ncbi:ABC transporter substrate-binding protein [Catellatospora methionotrophica]|uniref:ABC transporter substrate-binding protein n=1 Tax=Catellatospora methionotrophica TaxID=121620 RepID=A0A8J3PEG4_9ACTN|nr:helical backbone metal receptor [Catellatospora methionotrophica]GIG13669.1 ABC transporter substrate-binding protein [Catellatospora methionotrophica]